MTFALFSDVRETSTSTGTGDLVLAGAVASYFAFAHRYADGDTFYYGIKQGANREIGIGRYNASANSVSRLDVLESSNADGAVNWLAGAKDIYATLPGARALGTQPGMLRLWPNVAAEGAGPGNQVAVDVFGAPIAIPNPVPLITTTSGLAEVETVAAATGAPILVTQLGFGTSRSTDQLLGMNTTWQTHPRGQWWTGIRNASISLNGALSIPAVQFESAQTGVFDALSSQIDGLQTTGPVVLIKPTSVTPQDHLICWALMDFSVTSIAAASNSEACLKVDLSQMTTSTSEGVTMSRFTAFELNAGNYGFLVGDPPGNTASGRCSWRHNWVNLFQTHGQAVAGVQIGETGAHASDLKQNIYFALFGNQAAPDCFVTYESSSLFVVGADETVSSTNVLRFKSGAQGNVAICLDKGGATHGVVDENSVGAGGNIVIGGGAITIGQIPVIIAAAANVSQGLDSLGSGLGELIYRGASQWGGLAGSTSATMAVLTQTGTGTASAAPTWTSTTGSGNIVRASSPALVTPALGAATATSINKVAMTSPATGATLTIADGKTLTASNTVTLSGTDGSTVAFGAGGTVAYAGNNLSVFAATTSAQLAGVISDETGTGALVFGTSPVLTTPTLGVATATSLAVTGSTAPANGLYLVAANTPAIAANSLVVAEFLPTASAVNFLTLQGSATGGVSPGSATIAATGSDNSVNLIFAAKGAASSVQIGVGAGSQPAIRLNGPGSTGATNGFVLTGALAGSGPSIIAANLGGTGDTNIDLLLETSGSGLIRFATASHFSANGAVATALTSVGPTGSHTTVQEWLTIKDASGTTRYIPCF